MSEKQDGEEQRGKSQQREGNGVWVCERKKLGQNRSVWERNEEVEAGGGEGEGWKNIDTQEVGEISQEDKQLFGSGSLWIRGCKSEAQSTARHSTNEEKKSRNEEGKKRKS